MSWAIFKTAVLSSRLNPFLTVIRSQEELDEYLVEGVGYVLPNYCRLQGDLTASHNIESGSCITLTGNLTITARKDFPCWLKTKDTRLRFEVKEHTYERT